MKWNNKDWLAQIEKEERHDAAMHRDAQRKACGMSEEARAAHIVREVEEEIEKEYNGYIADRRRDQLLDNAVTTVLTLSILLAVLGFVGYELWKQM